MAYNVLAPFKLLSAGDMSGDLTSDPVYIQEQDNVGFQMNWTGDAVGPFSVEVSLDHKEDLNGNVQVEGHWVAITLSPVPAAAGTDDQAYVDITQLSAPWVRLVFTNTSGTGTLDVFATAKGV